jgi:RNA polymerase sigma-70 factor, ECF subfamily
LNPFGIQETFIIFPLLNKPEYLPFFSLNTELRKGNPDAFRELFNHTFPRLRGYCRLFVADDKMVEDIIQECFITLWEKKETISTDKSTEGFLFIMVRNRCLNYLKNKKLHDEVISLDKLNSIELQHLYQLDFTETEEKTIEEQLIQSFQQAIEHLPEKRKIIFKKCKIEGQKQSDVAAELGITLKAIEKQIAKAKQQIRKHLVIQFPALVVIIMLILE